MSHTLIVTDDVEIYDFAKQTLTATWKCIVAAVMVSTTALKCIATAALESDAPLKCIAAAVMDRAPTAAANEVIMEGASTLIFI